MNIHMRVGLEIAQPKNLKWRYKLIPLNNLCNDCMTPGEVDADIDLILRELRDISKEVHAHYAKLRE